MEYLDTQIISYSHKGETDWIVENKHISSIVACEFLMSNSTLNDQANYYIPVCNDVTHIRLFRKMDHSFAKKISDSILFNFSKIDQPPFRQYNNKSISNIINNKRKDLLHSSIGHLKKEMRKTINNKFIFLLDQNISCNPIYECDIETGYELLDLFSKEYNTKDNFKNTWNDILILSKTINDKAILNTNDKLLKKFAEKYFPNNITRKDDIFTLDFEDKKNAVRNNIQESKGYINNGWFYKIRTKNSPSL